MVRSPELALRPITAAGVEAVALGLIAGGCRLAFASPAAGMVRGPELQRIARRLERAGGALVQVQSDAAAALMAAGAALGGARAAALVADGYGAASDLAGLDDLSPVLVDVSGRLPLAPASLRAATAPHTLQAAFEAGQAAFARAEALRGPALIAGLELEAGELDPTLNDDDSPAIGPVPIHHDGPDDPEILLLGAGPGFAACAAAREQLEAEGVSAAHLHLVQITPFPGAIVAPAITSARRVLVVEPGGPATLAAHIRSHLGPPAQPFGELPRLAGAPLTPDEIAFRAREVMAL